PASAVSTTVLRLRSLEAPYRLMQAEPEAKSAWTQARPLRCRSRPAGANDHRVPLTDDRLRATLSHHERPVGERIAVDERV
ncbi:hypothetical protein, partial [Actinoplanes sp. ATCC 53533]|uniref:hypothetical protein n=1 Tax=Actinoplanes sp. ATCC 53533 TaxID=1288362 RepID=UPI001F3180D9